MRNRPTAGDGRPAAHMISMTTTIHTPATGCPTPSPAQTSPSNAVSRIADPNTLGTVLGSRDAGYRVGVDHLRAYIAGEDHANVPRKHVTDDGFKLGVWVNSRRSDRTVGRLSTARIAELDALGMVWGIHDAKYRIGVDHLRAYIAREGHANVPQRSVTDDGFTLGKWVDNRRIDRKVGCLSTARIAELDALGMAWGSTLDAGYRIGVDHLRAYIAQEGHANVPQKSVTDDGFKLGKWVSIRRRDHKVGRLSTARIAELDALGMVWDPRDAGYRIGADHLRAYAAAAGHANMPASHVADDGFKLGVWVANRRHDHTVGRLSTARIAELNTLGMVWDPRAA